MNLAGNTRPRADRRYPYGFEPAPSVWQPMVRCAPGGPEHRKSVVSSEDRHLRQDRQASFEAATIKNQFVWRPPIGYTLSARDGPHER